MGVLHECKVPYASGSNQRLGAILCISMGECPHHVGAGWRHPLSMHPCVNDYQAHPHGIGWLAASALHLLTHGCDPVGSGSLPTSYLLVSFCDGDDSVAAEGQ